MDTGEGIVSTLIPFLIVWAALFPRALGRIGLAADDAASADLRLIERVLGLFVIAAVAVVIVVGFAEVRHHWFIVMVLLVAYATLRTALVYGDFGSLRVRGFAGLMASLAIIVMLGLPVRAAMETASCDKCKMVIPFAQLVEAFEDSGFSGGTVFAVDQPVQLGGNLRALMPDARYESDYFPTYAPPANIHPGACLAVWLDDDPSSPPNAEYVARVLEKRFGVSDLDPAVDIHRAYVWISRHTSQIYAYFLIDDRSRQGTCH